MGFSTAINVVGNAILKVVPIQVIFAMTDALPGGIYCTIKNITTERPCNVKYCIQCLQNRYGEDAKGIKASGRSTEAKGQSPGGYTFKYVHLHGQGPGLSTCK